MEELGKELAVGAAKVFDIGNMSAEVAEKYIAFKKMEMYFECANNAIKFGVFFVFIYFSLTYVVRHHYNSDN